MKKLLLIPLLFASHTFAANFNSRFYQELTKTEKENINFSPISLKMALNLVYLGADGETKSFFEQEFNFTNRHPFQAEYELMKSLQKEKNSPTQLQLSNSVWFKNINLIENNYLKEIKSRNVPTGPLDQKMMNDWVEKATQGKIKNIIDSISPDMFAIFINAIYFKAQWYIPFEEKNTKAENFFSSKATTSKVQMMHQTNHILYHEDQLGQWIKLPYKGSPFVMYFALPKKRFALNLLEKKLTDDYLKKMEGAMTSTKVQLSLPQFKFDQKSSIKNILKNMGLNKLFERANYLRLSKNPELAISEIFQATSITVDEEGTEASAATAVMVQTGVAMPSEEKPRIFLADQPFIFILKNERTHETYFMGRMVKP